ncbi:hypothetical protein E2C01_074418 [Portunus trituberculatus]|uniref:Uncharacterized protein n=1 Tax=Portunus trituberculatus TaxID=210409 RepID=A0A5B7ICC8_PORTR|nr:hypothetical protein [Portunus trituberculatus]
MKEQESIRTPLHLFPKAHNPLEAPKVYNPQNLSTIFPVTTRPTISAQPPQLLPSLQPLLPRASPHLNHWHEVTEEAAEDPILHQEDGEGERQKGETHDELAHCDVHKVSVGWVPVQAAAQNVGDHSCVAHRSTHHQKAVEEDVERVDVGERVAEVRLRQIHRLVREGLKVVDDLCQHFVRDAADISTSLTR